MDLEKNLFVPDHHISVSINSLAVEIDEKGHTDRDLNFEQKRQEALEKNLTVHLLELILVEKILSVKNNEVNDKK